MSTKICRTCKKEYPLDLENFRMKKLKRDGSISFRFECRPCERVRVKQWKKDKPEKLKLQQERYKEKTRDSISHIKARMLKHAKRRAKMKNIDFSIDESHLDILPKCPVLGIDLKCSVKTSSPNSPTTDRKNNNKGYIPENVQVISFKANAIKGNATSDEIYKVALYAEQCEGKGNWFTRMIKRFVIKYF